MENDEERCPLCGKPVPQTLNHPTIAEHFAQEHPGQGWPEDLRAESRSVQRRKAAQNGQVPPEFDG